MSDEIRELLESGPTTSKEIQAATGLPQATVWRHLNKMGSEIAKLKSGKTYTYALTRNAFGAGNRIPLYQIDAYGNSVCIAAIRPLAHGGYLVELTAKGGGSTIFLGENSSGHFEELPFFLEELRPQGFIGRQIAIELSKRFKDFPSDPRRWSSNHIGRYLIGMGDDLPGNLILGDPGVFRLRKVYPRYSRTDYPKLADSVLSGTLHGSSAGGEQPKFTVFSEERSGHVIVKFSPQGDSAVARRWRDVLVTEYHAARVLHTFNLPSVESELIEDDGRLFLEAQRFDRHGEHGRLPMMSLQAVDAEFIGLGESWLNVLFELSHLKLISNEHVYDAAFLDQFGRQIHNTDMHLGNLSLGIEGNIFRLLPVYDMCSMGFAPVSGGEVLPFQFRRPDLDQTDQLFDSRLKRASGAFWINVAHDPRISEEFRSFIFDSDLTSDAQSELPDI